MKHILPFVIMCLVCGAPARSDDDSLKKPVDYPLIFQDSPAMLFTMQQVDQSYLSLYRLFSRSTNFLIGNQSIADIVQLSALCFYFTTFTHEEGHRSILTNEKIGSISVPYLNKNGAAYVKGVTDRTLKDLRDRNLPVYIRLHTAGLESDFMLTKRIEEMSAFDLDSHVHVRWEYIIRKLSILQYYIAGLFKFDIDLKEEADELERDIVGFDIYGAVRHLHRPTMEFYRYTQYDALTEDEKTFVHRAGYRSLLNAVNPLIIGVERFHLHQNITWSAGAGYTMAPFGDFIDEQVWITIPNNIHIGLYARQFQNYRNWFIGCGGTLTHYAPIEQIAVDFQGHFWQQPEKMCFRTDKFFFGGAVGLDASYFFLPGEEGKPGKGVSVDLGFLYKTEGFMPEVLSLKEHFGLKIGTTLRI